MTLAVDLLNPLESTEKQTHKLKRLVQSPNSYFMDVKCSGTFQGQWLKRGLKDSMTSMTTSKGVFLRVCVYLCMLPSLQVSLSLVSCINKQSQRT